MIRSLPTTKPIFDGVKGMNQFLAHTSIYTRMEESLIKTFFSPCYKAHKMKVIITFTCLSLIYSCLYSHCADGMVVRSVSKISNDEQVAQKYLTEAGLKFPANGEGGDKWITLCTVKARVASTSYSTQHDVKRCTTTVGGEILETRVVETENNWRCAWRQEVYTSNTLLSYKQTIDNQYKSAIEAAGKAKELEVVIKLLEEQRRLHIFNLEVATNKDTAMLEATATGLSFWRGGGSCAVKLEGRVRHLAY